ncbi:MAG: phosphohydrolase, partial [Ginsengibacter sp.]
SHALEHTLVDDHSHENISLLIMQELNVTFEGQLSMAIDIFKNIYQKKFLHQLISGQLDVDRMDYLNRDSFFTGVTEGVIAYDRILKMITVHNGNLMIEEKGIYSIEKFLVSRRLMYWQVYLHKTVLCAEQMLIKIIKRAKEINALSVSPILNIFLTRKYKAAGVKMFLKEFCQLDDVDVFSAIKNWTTHPDKVLSFLSTGITDRKLLKVKFFERPIPDELIEKKINDACRELNINKEEVHYVVLTGYVENRTYNSVDERIHILFKDGTVKNVSDVDNALINQTLSGTVKKFYICYNR